MLSLHTSEPDMTPVLYIDLRVETQCFATILSVMIHVMNNIMYYCNCHSSAFVSNQLLLCSNTLGKER